MSHQLSPFARRRRRLLASGCCDRCTRPALGGRTKCALHAAKTAKEVLRLHASRTAAGVCRECAEPLAPTSTLYCPDHLTALRGYVVRSTRGG